jgi:flagellar protein FliS
MNQYAAATYRQTLESTLSPADLLIRLYEGAIRCVDIIKESARSGDISRRADAVNRLTGILSELASAVDGQEPKDLSDSLVSLYLFLIQEVTLANVAGELCRLDPVREIIADLLGTWRSAVLSSRKSALPFSPKTDAGETPRRSLSVRG